MDYLFQDGGKPKKTKSKSTKSKSKTSTKTGSKTTKSKTTTKKSSSKKGGNFLGAVGDLVAPTGWGPFATAAGLLAFDRVDAALRRGKSTKSSAKKGGMRGGNITDKNINFISEFPVNGKLDQFKIIYNDYSKHEYSGKSSKTTKEYLLYKRKQNRRKKVLSDILELLKINHPEHFKRFEEIKKNLIEEHTLNGYDAADFPSQASENLHKHNLNVKSGWAAIIPEYNTNL